MSGESLSRISTGVLAPLAGKMKEPSPSRARAGAQAAAADQHGVERLPVVAPAVEHQHRGGRAAAGGDDAPGQRPGERAIDHLGDEMPDLHARRDRRGEAAVDHRAFGGDQADRRGDAVVVGDVRVEDALHGHVHVGVGEVVDDVAAPFHLRRGAGQVDGDVAAVNRHRAADAHVRLPGHLLDHAFGAIHAGRASARSRRACFSRCAR